MSQVTALPLFNSLLGVKNEAERPSRLLLRDAPYSLDRQVFGPLARALARPKLAVWRGAVADSLKFSSCGKSLKLRITGAHVRC